MHKISLSMIVKNENHDHFKECLDSVVPYIDYWVIADNGSSDGTQDFIRDYFKEKNIPGELHEVEWKSFGHNRTEALSLCDGKAEYALMIDADDRLMGKMQIPNKMDRDGYCLRIKRGDFTWWRNQIFKTGIGWKYVGVLHEYAECSDHVSDGNELKIDRVQGDYFVDARTLGGERNIDEDGSTIDAVKKYSRDAEILEKAMLEEPENTRYQFYLAQSYFDSQQWEKSEEAYAKRARMGGWMEEVFYSIFRVGIIKMIQEKPWPDCQDTFLQAFNVWSHRAEPLYQLAKVHRLNGNPVLAHMFIKRALEIPYPEGDILFIADEMYEWQMLDEFAAVAFYANDFENGLNASLHLIELCKKGVIPESEHTRMLQNVEHYQKVIQDRLKEAEVREEEARAKNELKKKNVESMKRKRQKGKEKKKKKMSRA